jgi:hypothetical protein
VGVRRIARVACVSATAVAALAVCVGKEKGGGPSVVSTIAISPDPAIVPVNGTQQFQVTPPVDVIWGITETTDDTPPAFPLKASVKGRYLVDGNGHPFFMVGDAAQSAAGALTYGQFTDYIDNRVSFGFNTINVNFVEHLYAPNPPADRDGNPPFIVPGDFSTPNDAYFAGLERKVAYAEAKGVYVLLAFYMGGSDHSEGWYNEVESNSVANCYSLGQYLANGHGSFAGFRAHQNIGWVWGADWLFTTDAAVRDRLHEVARGIRELAPAQLMSGDWGPGNATQQSGFETYMDLQNTYDYAGVVGTARTGYSYAPISAAGDGRVLPALPQFLKETAYEAEGRAPGGTPAAVREAQWWSILSGATTGLIYGNRDVWPFAFATAGYSPCLFPGCTVYTSSLASPGAQDMGRLAALIRSIAWHELVPSGTGVPFLGRTLIGDGNDSSDGGSVAAAQSPDGTLLVAYAPTTISFKVDLRGMTVPMRVRWWSPASGVYSVPGTSFDDATTYAFDDQVYYRGTCYRSLQASNVGHVPDGSPTFWQATAAPMNTGYLHVTTPGDNGSGADDWVLIIDPPSRCGSISSAGFFTAPSSVTNGVTCQVTATLQVAPDVVAHAQLNLR